jgi:hypothetical protein
VKLAAPGKNRVVGLVPQRPHQEVEPLIGGEVAPGLDKAVNIARRQLYWAQALYEKRPILAPEDVQIIVSEYNLCPNTTHQQAIMRTDQVVIDINIVEVYIR